jgi:short-subunit dehydrogenase
MARASHPILRAVGLAAAGMFLFRTLRRRARRLDLAGRVVLVTGGTRGLGLLIAEELGRRGARVAICGRDPRALAEAEKRLAGQGIEVLARPADLGDRAQAEGFVERASLEWDRIDAVVNNAGVIHVEPVASASLETLQEALRSNFWSAVHTTMAALPHLRAHGPGARVLNVVSIGGRVAVPHLLGYSASKFAFAGFSEGLAAELAREGIDVTTVYPGLMRTGSQENAEFAGDAEREMAWFSAGASLPLGTVNARRAARRIVRALRDGETIVHLGLPAAVLARLHGIAPATTVRMMALVDRFLPRPATPPEPARRGREIASTRRASPLRRLGEEAADQNNERPAS